MWWCNVQDIMNDCLASCSLGPGHIPGSMCLSAVSSIFIRAPHMRHRTVFPLGILKIRFQIIHFHLILLGNWELLSQFRVTLSKMPSPASWRCPQTGAGWGASVCAIHIASVWRNASAAVFQPALAQPALPGEKIICWDISKKYLPQINFLKNIKYVEI